MSSQRRTLHLGRLLISVPAHAELREFSATIGGVDLEELDLGDSSPEAGYLGWMQVSEQARETSGFDEVEVDERFWVALYGIAEPRVIGLQQDQDRALVLSASISEYEDAVARVHELRQRYVSSCSSASECFGLGLGQLELPPERPEEFAAALSCESAWSLSLAACAVSVPSPSNYEGLREGLLSSSESLRPPLVEAGKRRRGSLVGEELFMEVLGEGDLPVYQAIWRDAGQPRDSAHPEVELELTLRGLELEAARAEWELVVESLRLAAEDDA